MRRLCHNVLSPAKCDFWNSLLAATDRLAPVFLRKGTVDRSVSIHAAINFIDLGYVVHSNGGQALVEVRIDVTKRLLREVGPDQVMTYQRKLEEALGIHLGHRRSTRRFSLFWPSPLCYLESGDNTALIADLCAKMVAMHQAMQGVRLQGASIP